jgi:hypothetical protein
MPRGLQRCKALGRLWCAFASDITGGGKQAGDWMRREGEKKAETVSYLTLNSGMTSTPRGLCHIHESTLDFIYIYIYIYIY